MSDNPYGAPQQAGTTLGPSYSSSQQPPSSGLAITSMVLGIVGILGSLFSCCCGVLAAAPGVVLGIAAVITGIIALNKVKDGSGEGKGMAMAGVICGAVSILLGIVLIVVIFAFGPVMMEQMQEMQQQMQQQNR